MVLNVLIESSSSWINKIIWENCHLYLFWKLVWFSLPTTSGEFEVQIAWLWWRHWLLGSWIRQVCTKSNLDDPYLYFTNLHGFLWNCTNSVQTCVWIAQKLACLTCENEGSQILDIFKCSMSKSFLFLLHLNCSGTNLFFHKILGT